MSSQSRSKRIQHKLQKEELRDPVTDGWEDIPWRKQRQGKKQSAPESLDPMDRDGGQESHVLVDFGASIYILTDAETTVASAEDIQNRMEEQDRRFLALQARGELTHQWTVYGRKRVDQISHLLMRGKER
jgi:hypothetical protein